MNAFEQIAEQRIIKSIARGELSGLPGEGEPLRLDDDTVVPESLRMAFRIMKNAGLLPPQVTLMNAITALESEIHQSFTCHAKHQKLVLMKMQLSAMQRERHSIALVHQYKQRL